MPVAILVGAEIAPAVFFGGDFLFMESGLKDWLDLRNELGVRKILLHAHG
jgi:hypothetical protein